MIKQKLLVSCSFFLGILIMSGSVWPRSQSPAKSGTGTVSGIVKVDGKPAKGIAVVLAQCQSQQPLKYPPPSSTKTDEDGRFYLDSVPAGHYCINAFAPTFSPSSPRYDPNSHSFTVSDGETIDGIELSLVKGGVITGRVTGSDGRPAIEESVNILGTFSGQSFLKYERTDDRGVYRAYGLPAGSYIVSAGSTTAGESHPVLSARLETYYPNTSDAAQAKQVEVTAGEETGNIDIVCGRAPSVYKVTGKIVDDSTSLPISGARIMSYPVESGKVVPAPRFVEPGSDKNGEFIVEGLGPGHYVMRLGASQGLDAYSEDVPFEIIDDDVKGLVVRALPALSITGLAVLEGESSPAIKSLLSKVSLFAQNVDWSQHDPVHGRVDLNPDGSFKITGLRPGRFLIALVGSGRMPLILLRTERNGAVVNDGIDLIKGEAVTDLRVIFGYANGSMRGNVTVSGFTITPAQQIYVDVKNIDKPQFGPELIHPDARNQFALNYLLPGRYEVAVHEFIYGTVGGVTMVVSSDPQIINVFNDSESTVSLAAKLKPYKP